jgi:cytochrome c oxidase subunit 3
MLMFVACEGMFFAGLVSAFIILHAGAGVWPPVGQPRFPVAATAANTLVLLASGWTVMQARRALRGGRAAEGAGWLGWTALLGGSFLAVQGIEWAGLVRDGLKIQAVYGGLFIAIVGAHAIHVAGGLTAVLVTWLRARQRQYPASHRDVLLGLQIYWLFVVGLWPVLYGLVYFA